jgi:hypothetical protein
LIFHVLLTACHFYFSFCELRIFSLHHPLAPRYRHIFTTMDHNTKSTTQDAAASNSSAITAQQQRRRLRQQQLLHTQLPLPPGHSIPIVLRRRAAIGPRMNPQDLVRLLDQALAISAELVVATDDHRIVDSSTTTTPKNSTSHEERDSTE